MITTHPDQLIRNPLGTRLLYGASRIIHRLPLSWALSFGRFLGHWAPVVSPRHFQRICHDMTQAFAGELSPGQVQALARHTYRRLGESLVEFLRLPSLSADEIHRFAQLQGLEHLQAALALGKGVILLTAHVSNWELVGTVMGLSGYPTTAIARPQRDAGLTALFTRIREAHGLRVVPMSDVRGCLRVLHRNECLGILGDLNARTPGAFVQFFGRPAATYAGPAYLALATGATILPIFDERLPDMTHRCRIGPPISVERSGDRQRDLLITSVRVQHAIEDEIRRRPADWYWLVGRWKTQPNDVANPERIPMEHRDLSPAEQMEIRTS